MQRVVRSTLVGILTLVAAACGDKITVPPAVITPTPPPDLTVTAVTITPASLTMAINQSVTFAAVVTAGAGVTDRSVTWSSSNTAIATVDANGVVRAVAAGTTTIRATSRANTAVSGAAAVTVLPTQPVTVTISSINQTVCAGPGGVPPCSSVPATLTNVAGQIDVTLNVEAGTTALTSVTAILKCGTDSIVQTQTIGGVVAAEVEGEASAAAPVTFSFNTAALNAAGTGPQLRNNAACTIRAIATTATGAQSASTTTTLTINNPDVVNATVAIANRASDVLGNVYHGNSNVVISATPILYSGRTATSVTIGLTAGTATTPGGAAVAVTAQTVTPGTSVTFYNLADSAAVGKSVAGVSATGVAPTINVIDSQGSTINAVARVTVTNTNPAGSNVQTGGTFNLDNAKPLRGTLPIRLNTLQGTGSAGTSVFLNGNFRFVADSAAGFSGPDNAIATPANAAACNNTTTRGILCNLDRGGVDRVTVEFRLGTGTTTSAFPATVLTSTTSLAETSTATANFAGMLTRDALGNTDTAYTNGSAFVIDGTPPAAARFGVDKTLPTIVFTGGERDTTRFTDPTVPGFYILTAIDNLSGVGTYAGTGTLLVAQSRQSNGTSSTSDFSGRENFVRSNIAGAALTGQTFSPTSGVDTGNPCLIGRLNVTLAASGPGAIPVLARTGETVAYCTPVPFDPTDGAAGTSLIEADMNGQIGYIRTSVIVTDNAGNRGNTFLSSILVDQAAPVIQNVDYPATIAGGSSVSIPVAAHDSGTSNAGTVGDITSGFAQAEFPIAGATPAILLQYDTITVGVPFDNILTRTATANVTMNPFIKTFFQSDGTNGAGGRPPAAATGASSQVNQINLRVSDAARNISANVARGVGQAAGSNPQITGTNTNGGTGFTTFWSSTFTGGFQITNTNATVSNCPSTGCTGGAAASQPTSTTLTAVATGSTGTFTNPFTAVQVWYQVNGTGAWFVAQSVTSATSSDNGTNRFWTWTATFDPPAFAPLTSTAAGATIGATNPNLTVNGTTLNVRLVGYNGNGDAVSTPVANITIANP